MDEILEGKGDDSSWFYDKLAWFGVFGSKKNLEKEDSGEKSARAEG